MIAMTVTNALILPAIFLVPRHLIATPDGVLPPAPPPLPELPEPAAVVPAG